MQRDKEKIKKDTEYKEAMEQEISLMEKGFNMGTGGCNPACERNYMNGDKVWIGEELPG